MNKFYPITLLFVLLLSSISAKSKVANSLDQLFEYLAEDIPEDGVERSILILPFNSTEDTLKDEALMVAEYGVNYFIGTPGITIVDRQNVVNMMEEIQFSETELIDTRSALKLGKMLSASYIITGSISQKQHMHTISSRMIETETSRIIGASYAKFRSEEAGDFYKLALGEQLKASSALFRSMILPGWGQFYTNHPGHGITAATLFFGTAGVTIWSALDYGNKAEIVDGYEENPPLPDPNGTEMPAEYEIRKAGILNTATDDMNSAADRTNYLLIGLGSVWAVNVVDALILGRIESKKIKDTYFSMVPNKENRLTLAAGFTLNF